MTKQLHSLGQWYTFCVLSYNMTYRFLKTTSSEEFLRRTGWVNGEYETYMPSSYSDLHQTIGKEYERASDMIEDFPELTTPTLWVCQITGILTNLFQLEGVEHADARLNEVRRLIHQLNGYYLCMHDMHNSQLSGT